MSTIYDEIQFEIQELKVRAEYLASKKLEDAKASSKDLADALQELKLIDMLKGYARMGVKPGAQFNKIASEIAPSLVGIDFDMLCDAQDKATAKRDSELQKLGLTIKDFEPKYSCSECKDTGIIKDANGKRTCTCYKVRLASKLSNRAGLPIKDKYFTDISLDVYPDGKDRTYMSKVLSHAKKYVTDFESKSVRSMIFTGGTGTGKTYLAGVIASELMRKGIPTLYMPISSIFECFSAAAFADNDDKSSLRELKNNILNIPLLIIDDIGSEKQTDRRYEELLDIINVRCTKEVHQNDPNGKICQTIITTNLSPEQLFDYYGERVASRLLGNFDIIRFVGEDIRLKH